jgi:signal transduction histidine kinase
MIRQCSWSFAAARDVERKMFEKEMIDAKFLQKVNNSFLSNMSHEIRTPLNSILGFTNVLLKTGLDLQQKNTRSYKYKRQVFKSAYK